MLLGSFAAGKMNYTALCVQWQVNPRGDVPIGELESMAVATWRRRRKFQQLLREKKTRFRLLVALLDRRVGEQRKD
jgi:hypothetical protein